MNTDVQGAMTATAMTAPTAHATIRPSPMWTASVVAVVVLSLVIGAAATITSIRATRFIGEGELLFDDAAGAAARVAALTAGQPEMQQELKRIRNDLGIEAVSHVEPGGIVTSSTSPTLVGLDMGEMLVRAMGQGRFAAVASPTPREVEVDGITEWQVGDVLYEAMHPLDSGAILLSYDVSELLERRAVTTQVPPQVVPMAVASGMLMLVAAGLATARARATRTRRELAMEAEYLRRESEDLQRHNQELELARAETEGALALAEEKNRIRSEFVLMINHELRTPLTGVVTGARVLHSHDWLDKGDRQILEDMIHDGDRLEAIIGQMLAVARVENRGLKVVPLEMSLDELVARLRRAHRSIEFTASDELLRNGPTVITDATTLAQLVASLADNAITHGATHVEVSLSDRLPDDPHLVVGATPRAAVHVIVGDDGPGIDPEFLPRAFEKFQKSGRSSGTGLGLHFAQMMAESIGASISVHTSLRGTWIAVSVPASTTPQRVVSKATA